MKNILFYIALFFAAYFLSCNKIDLPDPVQGTPIFNATLNFFNGETITWEAGVDDYYMFTEFEKDNLGINSFIGRMEKENCDTCTETLAIYIRDVPFDTSGSPDPNRSPFNQDEYYYFSKNNTITLTTYDTTTLYEVNLIIDATVTNFNANTEYEWNIDGNIYIETNPTILLDFISPQTMVTLKVTDSSNGDSCVVWQTQYIKPSTNERCAVRIGPDYDPNLFLESLSAIPEIFNGQPSFFWNNGSSENIYFDPIEPGVPISVTMTDNIECQSTAGFVWSGNMVVDTLPQCSAHFTYEVTPVFSIDSTVIGVTNDSFQYSAVTIVYKNKDGLTFRSDLNPQNENANFNILNVEEYDDNELGYPTKKLDLQFNCTLWSDNIDQGVLIIENGNAVWGVAVPK